jgi:hypothetical protein
MAIGYCRIPQITIHQSTMRQSSVSNLQSPMTAVLLLNHRPRNGEDAKKRLKATIALDF